MLSELKTLFLSSSYTDWWLACRPGYCACNFVSFLCPRYVFLGGKCWHTCFVAIQFQFRIGIKLFSKLSVKCFTSCLTASNNVFNACLANWNEWTTFLAVFKIAALTIHDVLEMKEKLLSTISHILGLYLYLNIFSNGLAMTRIWKNTGVWSTIWYTLLSTTHQYMYNDLKVKQVKPMIPLQMCVHFCLWSPWFFWLYHILTTYFFHPQPKFVHMFLHLIFWFSGAMLFMLALRYANIDDHPPPSPKDISQNHLCLIGPHLPTSLIKMLFD